jgi:ABC-2 type transport system permease protein
VNLQHLRAFLWLHWRLRVNQLQRGGIANRVILALLTVSITVSAVGLFVGAFALAFVFEKVPPVVLLFIWDGLVVVFLFLWATGLLVDLQRSEALSLTKFLHLPVSLSGVFVLNYLSSLFSLNMLLFVPIMVGFILGLGFTRRPEMLLLLPLLAAFLLMVSAISYQFQGWLASLMVDKRRRRTVIFVVTLVSVLIFQLPYLVNFIRPWEGQKHDYSKGPQTQEQVREFERTAWLVNVVLPPGWLPIGVMSLAEGDVLPALLGTLGLTLIGTASLWRGYRTTLKLYTGQYTAGTKQPAAAAPSVQAVKPPATVQQPAGLITREIPWLSEQASAVALACFRSITRAPEVRMLLLTPIFLLVIFSGMFMRGSLDLPDTARPLLAFSAISTILLTLVQLVGNQFGFDRGGFRVFVLSPASRRDILLGKNLAVLPVTVVFASPLLVLIQAVYPMRIDFFFAVVPQFISMYLLFCLLANYLSIFAPMPIAAGSLKPTNTKWLSILVAMAFVSLFPLAMLPTLVPLGVEAVLELLEWRGGIPVCLILSVVECVAIVYFYRLVLTWQGALLQSREQRILEVVSAKAE